MRELRKVRKFIRTRRGKNEFEQQFLDLYGIFEEEGGKNDGRASDRRGKQPV